MDKDFVRFHKWERVAKEDKGIALLLKCMKRSDEGKGWQLAHCKCLGF